MYATLPLPPPRCPAVYANAVDSAISQGTIALMFIDDGRLVEANKEGDLSAMVATDLWAAIKEVVPHKVGARGSYVYKVG